jgi:aquaporin Z
MTTAPYWLDEFYTASAVFEKRRALDKYAVEALGTFGFVLTVGIAVCSRNGVAALGIGAVLMAVIYAGGYRFGAHLNPAITLAAAMWGRIPFGEAAAYWLAQLAAGLCAAIATRLIVGSGQAVMEMMLSGRVLVAAFGAELLFALCWRMWCSAWLSRGGTGRTLCGTWLSVSRWWRARWTLPRCSAACIW